MPTRVSGEAVCGGACFKGQHSPRGRRTRWRGSPGRSQTLPPRLAEEMRALRRGGCLDFMGRGARTRSQRRTRGSWRDAESCNGQKKYCSAVFRPSRDDSAYSPRKTHAPPKNCSAVFFFARANSPKTKKVATVPVQGRRAQAGALLGGSASPPASPNTARGLGVYAWGPLEKGGGPPGRAKCSTRGPHQGPGTVGPKAWTLGPLALLLPSLSTRACC